MPLLYTVPAFLLLTLPWLNPFASGPSPAVVPLLFTWMCAAALLGLWVWRKNVLPRSQIVATVAAAWLAAGLISSALGLLQYFGAAGALDPWVSQTAVGDAFANLRQRNQFATLTNIAQAALLWWVHLLHAAHDESAAYSASVLPARRIGSAARATAASLTWLAAALLAAGNAASSSRTGLLQLVALVSIVPFWGGWRYRAIRHLLVAAALGYGVAVIALPWFAGLDLSSHGILARLRDGAPACASRWLLWSNVLELIVQKPWLGWGWGELDYAHYTHIYSGPRFCDILDNAHNLPLHLAVELGVPVALLICGVFVGWVWRRAPWRETDPTRQLAWAVLAVIGLHSLVEYPLWYGPFQMAVLACLLLLRRSPKTPQAAIDESNNLAAQMFIAIPAIALIAALSFAAFDYRRVSQIYLPASQRDPALREDTLDKIRDTWLFRNQFLFAELSLAQLVPGNAPWTYATALDLLHYSPEPRVVEKVIESATMLGREDEAVLHLARYRAAFPVDYTAWLRRQRGNDAPLPKPE